MKNLILLIVVMVLSACATTPTMKSVAGTYAILFKGQILGLKTTFFENGKVTHHRIGVAESTFKIVGKEIHHKVGPYEINVYEKKLNGDLIAIAEIDKDGKRKELSKGNQFLWEKIK